MMPSPQRATAQPVVQRRCSIGCRHRRLRPHQLRPLPQVSTARMGEQPSPASSLPSSHSSKPSCSGARSWQVAADRHLTSRCSRQRRWCCRHRRSRGRVVRPDRHAVAAACGAQVVRHSSVSIVAVVAELTLLDHAVAAGRGHAVVAVVGGVFVAVVAAFAGVDDAPSPQRAILAGAGAAVGVVVVAVIASLTAIVIVCVTIIAGFKAFVFGHQVGARDGIPADRASCIRRCRRRLGYRCRRRILRWFQSAHCHRPLGSLEPRPVHRRTCSRSAQGQERDEVKRAIGA